MLVFLNGQFIPEEQAVVSVFDRGFLFGDGLFETLRVFNHRPFRWDQHLQRLLRGAEFLRVDVPFSGQELRTALQKLTHANDMPDALLRINVSRGSGPRGYSLRGANRPSVVLSLHPAPPFEPRDPPRWRLASVSFRLPPGDPLARFKTSNKLLQVMARAEAEAAGAQEALLLDSDGWVAECASSNIFWIQATTVHTPPLSSGILPGVTRSVIKELCRELRLGFAEDNIGLGDLAGVDGVFLSLSSAGVAEAISLDGHTLRRSALAAKIRTAYEALVRAETSSGLE